MLKFHKYSFPKLLAPDTGLPSGSNGDETKPTLLERVTAAESARDKFKDDLSVATGQVASLAKERDDLKTENTRLQSQFTSATAAATDAQRERDEARTQLAAVTTDRDRAKNDLAVATGNVDRLEALCGVKGIDHTKAVPSLPGDGSPTGASMTQASFTQRLQATKDPKVRATIRKEFSDAVKAGRITG